MTHMAPVNFIARGAGEFSHTRIWRRIYSDLEGAGLEAWGKRSPKIVEEAYAQTVEEAHVPNSGGSIHPKQSRKHTPLTVEEAYANHSVFTPTTRLLRRPQPVYYSTVRR